MKNIKVTTEIEALKFCKENQCKIEFRKETSNIPAHVKVSLGLVADTIGKDLVEAVNRVVDMYFTPPDNYDKLSWWNEQKTFYYR